MRISFLLPLVMLGLAGCVDVHEHPNPQPSATIVTPAPRRRRRTLRRRLPPRLSCARPDQCAHRVDRVRAGVIPGPSRLWRPFRRRRPGVDAAALAGSWNGPMTAPYPAAALEPEVTAPLVLALPKGRILGECGQLLARAGVVPAADYADEESRRLRFPTDDPTLDVVRVRPFDVATFVAFGAAQLGICGADVLMEFDYPEIYAPLDLGIGVCRVSVAEPAADGGDRRSVSVVAGAGGDEVSQYRAAAFRFSGGACRGGAPERGDGAGAGSWAVAADRGSGADGVDAAGEWAGGDRGDRADHVAADRQQDGVEDAAGGDWGLDCPVPGGFGGIVMVGFVGRAAPPPPDPLPQGEGEVGPTSLPRSRKVSGGWLVIRLATNDRGFEEAFTALLGQARETTETVDQAVAAIIAEVRAEGDTALLRYTERFDRLALTRGQAARWRGRDRGGSGWHRAFADGRAGSGGEPDRGVSSLAGAGRPADDGCGRADAGHAMDAAGCGRAVCAWGEGGVSVLGADERNSGTRRRGGPHRHVRAEPGWRAEPAGAGGGTARRCVGNLSRGRCAGDRGIGVWDCDDCAGGSHRGAGQRLCR